MRFYLRVDHQLRQFTLKLPAPDGDTDEERDLMIVTIFEQSKTSSRTPLPKGARRRIDPLLTSRTIPLNGKVLTQGSGLTRHTSVTSDAMSTKPRSLQIGSPDTEAAPELHTEPDSALGGRNCSPAPARENTRQMPLAAAGLPLRSPRPGAALHNLTDDRMSV